MAAANARPQLSESSQALNFQRENWNSEEIKALVDVWGDAYMKIKRGNLTNKHWSDITQQINSQLNTNRSEKQVRNKVDTIKKRYKREKGKRSRTGEVKSTWEYFDRVDLLLGCTLKNAATPQLGLSGGADLKLGSEILNLKERQTPAVAPAAPNPNVAVKVSSEHGSLDGSMDSGNKSASEERSSSPPIGFDTFATPRTQDCSIPGGYIPKEEGRMKGKKKRLKSSSQFNSVAESIQLFGDALFKIEQMKLELGRDLEERRLQMAKDMENRRLELAERHLQRKEAMEERRMQRKEAMEERRREMQIALMQMKLEFASKKGTLTDNEYEQAKSVQEAIKLIPSRSADMTKNQSKGSVCEPAGNGQTMTKHVSGLPAAIATHASNAI